MNDPALLVGNGVNMMSNGITWKQLLTNIIEYCNCGELNQDRDNPFPLFYEQVFLHSVNNGNISDETELKKFIASQVSSIRENEVHELIRNKGLRHIMTANYEYLLEGGIPKQNDGIVKETKYSVFRHAEMKGTKFWHLHGDCNNPQSINLGYEHYSGQLQQMRNYVTTVTSYKSKKLNKLPLARRLKSTPNNSEVQSWIDLFFTTDIHIIGLTLDFVEIDIWWLLTYRARMLNYDRKFPIQNVIRYYVPKNNCTPNDFKIKLLRSTGVEVVPIDIEHGASFYKKVLSGI
jgi:hypothetical protein